MIQLAEGGGRLDVLPPGPAKIAQIIRRPAEAAGLSFEFLERGAENAQAGISLDQTILEEVVREPGALPLLSYLLDQLYRFDVLDAHGSTLTYASYERLRGLKGAIAARAEAVLAEQDADVRLALRRLLFLLVQISETDTAEKQITARRAPLSLFAEGSPVRRLLNAFVDPSARLVIAEGSAEEPTFRVAHEALFREWALARELVAQIAGELKTRKIIEERYERWKEISRDSAATQRLLHRWIAFSEPGLLTDADLDDARRLVAVHRDALLSSRVAYVDRSAAVARRKRNFTVQGLAALVGVLSILSVTAVVAAISANHFSAIVRHSLSTLDLQHKALQRAEQQGDKLVLSGKRISPLEEAIDLYSIEIAFGTTMNVLQPDNPIWLHDIASGTFRTGYALEKQGHISEAFPSYLKSFKISKQLVAKDPSNGLWKQDLAVAIRFVNKTYKVLHATPQKTASRP